jgi:hypothetical protein
MDKRHEEDNKIYEFTQLMNSMLGMIICLREDYYKGPPTPLSQQSVPSVTWEDVQQYPALNPSESIRKKADAFSTLISNLRHALAHSKWDFIVDENGEINGVEVHTDTGWEAKLYEADLREIAYLAVDYLELSFGLELRGKPK